MTKDTLFLVVSELALAIQAASAYPENHPRVQELLVRLHRRVQSEAERLRGLNIGFFSDHVVVDEFPFVEPNPTLNRLIERMREKGIEKILISEGITFGELKRFVYFLAEGTRSSAEQIWESIVYGRIEGAESAGVVSLGLAPASRPSGIMAGMAEVLKDVLVSMVTERKSSKVEEGRDIVSSIMKGLRQEGMLIDRLIRLQGHDDYTVTHSLNVCILVVAQAVHIGLPENRVREAGLAAMLHDIGKELTPSGILTKPGRLDMDEFDLVKRAPGGRREAPPEDRLRYRPPDDRRVRAPYQVRPDRLSEGPHPGAAARRLAHDADRRRLRRPAQLPPLPARRRTGTDPVDHERGPRHRVRAPPVRRLRRNPVLMLLR